MKLLALISILVICFGYLRAAKKKDDNDDDDGPLNVHYVVCKQSCTEVFDACVNAIDDDKDAVLELFHACKSAYKSCGDDCDKEFKKAMKERQYKVKNQLKKKTKKKTKKGAS